ncbi:U3 small nucleolar RNA-associated protein 6-domain-containing protein [Entophlyctis helioformis]|nr:U3 small nucleolar RNA-associated protein 6-domain-containing protein [Entophlyctis helioformis]
MGRNFFSATQRPTAEAAPRAAPRAPRASTAAAPTAVAMADQVHFHLEAMLPELNDLERKGVFSALEIKAIVKKRTAFEYSIHRRIAKKADFVKYIEYETNLEKLRRKRKDRFNLDRPAEQGGLGISLSDYSIVRRIHTLYQKTLKKFKGDVRLWLQYFEWCKIMGSVKALGKSFANAIQMHPTKAVFWILAAAWEFEHNSDVASARVLLQRGLRINPTDKKLWLEYFKLELLWVHKLKERRRVLFKEDLDEMEVDEKDSDEEETGEAVSEEAAAAEDAEDAEDATGVDVPTLDVEDELEAGVVEKDKVISKSKDVTADSLLQKKDLTPAQIALLDVLIPRAIYRNAIKVVPHDLAFRFEFINVYKQFGKGSAKGLEEAYESLVEDFSANPDALSKIAERHLDFMDASDPAFPAALKSVVQEYEALLAAAASTSLASNYIAFLTAQRAIVDEDSLVRYFDILIRRAYDAAQKDGYCSVDMFLDWSRSAESDADATVVLEKALVAHPASPRLWLEHIDRLATIKSKKDAFVKAVAVVDRAESLPVWEKYTEFLVASGAGMGEIETAFKTAISRKNLGGTPHEDELKIRYVEWSFKHQGIAPFRQLRAALAKTGSTLTTAFFMACIRLEMQQWQREVAETTTADANRTKAGLEKLWESAVNADRSNLDTWIGYIRFTFEVAKDPSKAAQLYWLAGKEVDDKDELETVFQSMKQ